MKLKGQGGDAPLTSDQVDEKMKQMSKKNPGMSLKEIFKKIKEDFEIKED